jgi:hypothetical protein
MSWPRVWPHAQQKRRGNIKSIVGPCGPMAVRPTPVSTPQYGTLPGEGSAGMLRESPLDSTYG